MRKVWAASFVPLCILAFSCSKSKAPVVVEEVPLQIEELNTDEKNHQWYSVSENGIEQIDLPQNSRQVMMKPWTEAVRISSAASVPLKNNSTGYDAYAVVNRSGILAFNGSDPQLYSDTSIFSTDTADSLVFSNGIPVFYLYRSTFFNTKSAEELNTIQQSRPFLVEFDPSSKVCYPLVSYANLNLLETDQISGFFWNGTKWACSVKSQMENGVGFSYFSWSPLVELTDLSPALNKDVFVFSSSSEAEYRGLNMPHLFEDAPKILKNLLASIPERFSFYVSWRDDSGTSPVNYFQEGNGSVPVNASALSCSRGNYAAAVFEDGTTYIQKTDSLKSYAFRLPRLPASYAYGEAAVSGDTLIVAWEEKDFYKTGRAGFITVDLTQLLK